MAMNNNTSDTLNNNGTTPSPSSSDVSRSGRVRKKNSLLAEYESLEEIEKAKKNKGGGRRGSDGKIKGGGVEGQDGIGKRKNSASSRDSEGFLKPKADLITKHVTPGGSGTKQERKRQLSPDIVDKSNGHGGGRVHHSKKVKVHHQPQPPPPADNKNMNVVKIKKKNNVQTPKNKETKSQNNGSVNKANNDTKEKTTPRFTAYTLWMKDQRAILSKKYPTMDSSSLSKKLSEMWHTIPESQKKLYKNKADKMKSSNVNVKNTLVTPIGSGKKRGRPRIHPLPPDAAGSNGPSPALKMIKSGTGAPTNMKRKIVTTAVKSVAKPSTSRAANGIGGLAYQPVKRSSSHKLSVMSSKSTSAKSKGAPYRPVDVAAHLALLGESLTNLGGRLMNADRQPASGSLSVLMDSLLCSITPLICLTQQVPELNCIPQGTLERLMDIHTYIMPGLGISKK